MAFNFRVNQQKAKHACNDDKSPNNYIAGFNLANNSQMEKLAKRDG
jgi:hypothetical protein